jgi:hypothetical protein
MGSGYSLAGSSDPGVAQRTRREFIRLLLEAHGLRCWTVLERCFGLVALDAGHGRSPKRREHNTLSHRLEAEGGPVMEPVDSLYVRLPT